MISSTVKIYLASEAVDLRGAFDRLAMLTRTVVGKEPTSGALFLFFNRRRNRLKALWWDVNGYTILYKRLSSGTFCLPHVQPGQMASVEISATQMSALIAGLDVSYKIESPPTIH